jgi:hypothetical protein
VKITWLEIRRLKWQNIKYRSECYIIIFAYYRITVQSSEIPFDNQNPTNNLTPIFTAFFQALSSSIFSTTGSTVLRSALNNNTLQDQNNSNF